MDISLRPGGSTARFMARHVSDDSRLHSFPYALLLATLATISWKGVWGIFYLLPGLSALLVYTGCYPKPIFGLPLSEEYIQSRGNMKQVWLLIRFICTQLLFGAILAIQFVMYKLNLGLYIGCYIVIVTAGFSNLPPCF